MINFLSPSRTFRPPLHVPCESCPLPLPGCGEVCSPSAPYLPSATSPLLQWRWREPPSFDCCYGRAATRHQNLREKEREVLAAPPVAPSSVSFTCIIWRGLLLFPPLPLCDCTSCTKCTHRERERERDGDNEAGETFCCCSSSPPQ
jgi:hypothetical protein